MDIFLHDASFVITFEARTAVPFLVDDLLEEGIIKSDQEITNAETLPDGMRVFFGDNCVFEATIGRSMLLKGYSGPDNIEVSRLDFVPDSLEGSATRLADASKLLGLASVGINFTFRLDEVSIDNLARNLPEGAEAGTIGFSVDRAPFRVSMTLTKAWRDSFSIPGLIIDTNFSGVVTNTMTMNSRAEQIKEFISLQTKCLDNSKEILNELFV